MSLPFRTTGIGDHSAASIHHQTGPETGPIPPFTNLAGAEKKQIELCPTSPRDEGDKGIAESLLPRTIQKEVPALGDRPAVE